MMSKLICDVTIANSDIKTLVLTVSPNNKNDHHYIYFSPPKLVSPEIVKQPWYEELKNAEFNIEIQKKKVHAVGIGQLIQELQNLGY